jgi:hypothetical protein
VLSPVETIEIGCFAIGALGIAAKRAIEQLPIALEKRQHIAARIPRFFKSGNWAYAPFVLICIAALLWISQNLPWSLSAPVPISNAPVSAASVSTGEFVKDQMIERRLPVEGGSAQPVIVYHARYLSTGKHLRAILEYAGIDYIPPLPGIMQQVVLGDFRDFIKNGDLPITIISREGRTFWWGHNKEQGALYLSNMQVRIRLISDDGKE